jgi:hypothetical protein
VCFERRVIKVRRSVLEPLSLLRSSLQRRNSCQGLARRDRNRGLNDGQIPNFRGVRVALDTGYHRVEGNRRASRNGRVSSSPTRNPERCDSPLLHRLHPKLSRSLSLSVSLSVPLSLSVSVSLSLSVYLSLSRSRSRSLTTRVGVQAVSTSPPPLQFRRLVSGRGLSHVRFLAEEALVLTLAYDNKMRLYDARAGQLTLQLENPHACAFSDAAYDAVHRQVCPDPALRPRRRCALRCLKARAFPPPV